MLGVVHSSGLDDPGPVRGSLALCLLLAWALIFLCTLKGIRSSGKVSGPGEGGRDCCGPRRPGPAGSVGSPSLAFPWGPSRAPAGAGVLLPLSRPALSFRQIVYFTATFPYVVIVVLIIRGATLEGSIEGVRFYLSADWSRLQSAQVPTGRTAFSNCVCVRVCVRWGGGRTQPIRMLVLLSCKRKAWGVF